MENYFAGAFQVFYTRASSSHSKVFSYLKSLKIICERLIRNEVAGSQPARLRKKLFLISSHIYFAFIFSERIRITLSEEAFKVCEQIFFLVILLVIYLFNYDTSKSTSFMLNVAFDFVLGKDFLK